MRGRRTGTVLIFVLLVACGDDDSGGGRRDAALDDSGGGGGDGPAADAPPGECLPGTYDIDKAWGFTQGPHAIAGAITLPAELQAGRGIQLNILQVSPGSGNTVDFAILSTAKSVVTYRARGLVDGTWRICLRADANGNNALNDVGVDFTGCYDGSVAAPITSTSEATPIVLGGTCHGGKDFGIGYY
jgi:hypothetical protein